MKTITIDYDLYVKEKEEAFRKGFQQGLVDATSITAKIAEEYHPDIVELTLSDLSLEDSDAARRLAKLIANSIHDVHTDDEAKS